MPIGLLPTSRSSPSKKALSGGHTYSPGKTGSKLDRATITGLTPNENLDFHVVMPNEWELDWQMSVSGEGGGS
tara:strand:- start:161 stop:379 length:219 start_codon:yes stop_codon:yes gene_type:complete